MTGIWTLIASFSSFFITMILGIWMIPFLRKIKYGQTILEIGPSWHKSKEGTPTMGGIMFIIGILVSTIVCVLLFYSTHSVDLDLNVSKDTTVRIFAGLGMAFLYGLVGFIDDYIKVVKKRNLGLKAMQKLVLQFSVAIAYLAAIKYVGGASSETIIPFIGSIDLGIFYWIISAIVIVGMVNAVNLSDGIDGLNGSITFFAAVALMTIASVICMSDISIMSGALAGGCLGFLIWNFHPARVFMGDTGSLFLGGMVCAVTYALNMPILMLLVGIMYLVEMFSVILQVTYFKATKGKRLFRMSPIHHHFELGGWSEIKITVVFSAVTILMGVAALFLVKYGI